MRCEAGGKHYRQIGKVGSSLKASRYPIIRFKKFHVLYNRTSTRAAFTKVISSPPNEWNTARVPYAICACCGVNLVRRAWGDAWR
jgi:hypothetical protein